MRLNVMVGLLWAVVFGLAGCGGGGSSSGGSTPTSEASTALGVPASDFTGTWAGTYSGTAFSYVVTQSGDNITITRTTPIATGITYSGTGSGNTAKINTYGNGTYSGYTTWTKTSSTTMSVYLNECIPITGFSCGGSNGITLNLTKTAVTVPNTVPIANAGTAQSVVAGAVVTLDGSASSDTNNDPLTYSWSFTSKPVGSSAVLSSSTNVKPTFTANIAGVYVFSLIVNDGKLSSTAATVTVTALPGNTVPIAKAGTAQSVVTGAVVTLDGSSSSDANSDPLTYIWSFTSKPVGSSAVLSSATNVKPTFTANVVGIYVLNLVVNDGKLNSAASTVTITASDPKHLNIAYTARNGLTVTLTSFNKVDTGGYYNYTATYTQKNNTTAAIDEGQVKLYLSNNTGMSQYGFFGTLFPGDTQSRNYTFKVLYTSATPSVLEFDHDNFSASTPVTGSLQWIIPIPN